MSDLPKILSKREIELEELEEAKYVQSLRDDIEKLQEQLNTAKKNIEHAIGTINHDGHLGTIQTDWILPYLEKALAEIGGDDDENRL